MLVMGLHMCASPAGVTVLYLEKYEHCCWVNCKSATEIAIASQSSPLTMLVLSVSAM